jgi:uncharacterized protein (TIGR02246 family)
MRKMIVVACATTMLLLVGRSLFAQATMPAAAATTQPAAGVTTPDPTQAIGQMREQMVDAFNKGDLDRLLSHLDPDVVVTWQNGEVCRGPEAVRAYYNKMMTGPDKRVEKVSADPKVDDRHVYGDWAVSWGRMNDHFVLTDGSQLAMDSRFTATIAKRGDVWKVASFHASVNAFDNPILGMAARKAGSWALMVGILAGIVIGLVVGIMMGRRRAPKPATTA